MINSIEQIIDYLDNQYVEIKERHAAKKIGFMLGSTVSRDPNQKPYATPVRGYKDEVIFGAIVFNQVDAIIIASRFKDKVDKFYIDIEKKLAIDLNPKYDLLNLYGIDSKLIANKNQPELGNISQAISKIVSKKKLIPYKANDLTVEAVWNFTGNFFGELSGKNIFIVGLGNIGSKLALKFVESGVDVKVHGTDSRRDKNIVESLNEIKNRAVLASISLAKTLEFDLLNADCLILATSSLSVIKSHHVKCANKCSLVIDVGKGNLDPEALELFIKNDVSVWRADITTYLPIALSQNRVLSEDYSRKFGRNLVGGIGIVSGGYVGKKNDVVVDDYSNPKKAHGVCDGHGGFLDPNNEAAISLVEKLYIGITGK
jgi:5,10-methylene-tetrahydrofolate dehydrogenase/methenyl tetrahydrofolate cyclohydrolase